jgi:hypothetical protein
LAPRARPGNKAQYKWAEAFDHLEGLCRKARSGGKDEPDPAKVVGDFLENLDPKHQPTPRSVQRHVNEWRKRRVL